MEFLYRGVLAQVITLDRIIKTWLKNTQSLPIQTKHIDWRQQKGESDNFLLSESGDKKLW